MSFLKVLPVRADLLRQPVIPPITDFPPRCGPGPASVAALPEVPVPRRSLSPLRALRRCSRLIVVLLLAGWALFHVAAAVALAVLLGLLWLAALPIRDELRIATARLLPRHRRRVRMSDADVDSAFRHIVREEFGSSR